MSDSNHDYTRYEEWGDRNRYDEVQASTIVLRGAEDTMAAITEADALCLNHALTFRHVTRIAAMQIGCQNIDG